ncbi:MAG TPA: ribosome recycling factor [Victivallales bacterium]|nr:ribosome recycling factor [Victivallales bacterium]
MSTNIDDLMDILMERMEKTIDAMKVDFTGIRTGKASPALVENILIDYYGTATKLKELAGITSPEPRLLVIQPYDPGSVSTIEKAISTSKVGINPVSDGKILRLPIPELSEERRSSLTKQVGTRAEEARVSIRNIRREGNDIAKKSQKNTEITEDDLKIVLKDIQELTDSSIKDVDSVLKEKENELMNI